MPQVIIQCYFIYFVAQTVLAFGFGNFFSWLWCPFDIPDWATAEHRVAMKSSSGLGDICNPKFSGSLIFRIIFCQGSEW